MRRITFLLIYLFSSFLVKSQCPANAGPDITLGCGDTAQLNVELFLTKEVSNTTKRLSAIFFVNYDLGFIGGQDGVILKTTDGGENWTPQVYLPSEWWIDIFFINETTGYAVSYGGGRIIKTTDSGATWTTVFHSTSANYHLKSVWFTDENHGFAAGADGLILTTSDAGSNWIVRPSGTTEQLNDVVFTNGQSGYIVGEHNILLKTTNGGVSWSTSNPYIQPLALTTITFVNESVGYICGEFYLVLVTNDGGNTWIKMSGAYDKSYMGDMGMSFTSETTGYFCGTYPSISKTTDSGLNWTVISPLETAIFYAIDCPDNQSFFTVSDNGGIYSYHEPVSYHWEPSTGLNSAAIQNPSATPSETTTYIVSVTTSNGCIATDTVTVFVNKSSFIPVICLVTVEPNTNFNKIVWEKQNLPLYDSLYIYKEGSIMNQFDKIGTLAPDQLSEFVDTQSNALVQSNRYEISFKDFCKIESEKSLPHKTMHLSINQGIGNTWNLIWEPYDGYTVTTYNIYRGTSQDDLVLIASLSGGNTQYSDLNAATGNVYYQIEAVSDFSCSPTKMYNSSYSNVASYVEGNTNIPETCLVTVDPSQNMNRIIWNKPGSPSVDQIYIYKEGTTQGQYLKIASVAQSELSEYVDISSNPLELADRYKLSTHDIYNNESDKSTAHRNVFLSISEGLNNGLNLSWNEYEGYAVTSYGIYRGNTTSSLQKIAILSAGNSQYSDLSAPTGDVYYQIEAAGNFSCNPSKSFNSSFSNIAEYKADGIELMKLDQLYIVYPNPVKSTFTIQTAESLVKSRFEIVNTLGTVIKSFDASLGFAFDISELPAGIYYLRIQQDQKSHNTKIIKL